MFERVLKTVLIFFSNHFEIIFLLWVTSLVFFLVILLAVKMQEKSLRKVLSREINQFLFGLVVAGQIILLGMTGYVYWLNYAAAPPEFRIPEDVLPTTQWVRQDLDIYFIDGQRLYAVDLQGRHKRLLIEAEEPLLEYAFSPDGRYVSALTRHNLYVWDSKNAAARWVDGVSPPKGTEAKAVMGRPRWAPNSRYLVYQVAKWSAYSSQETWKLYDVVTGKKVPLNTPTRKLSSLYWDKSAKNLYYIDQRLTDDQYAYDYEVRVFRIDVDQVFASAKKGKRYAPELVASIPYDRKDLPVDNLRLRGIELFLEGDRLVFDKASQHAALVSDKETRLGIDKDDYLYFIPNTWFRKRLFKVAREPVLTDNPYQHQYKGGPRIIQGIRWLPGGRYVFMEHRYFGPMILDPLTGKVGMLVPAGGEIFGWYTPVL